MEAACQHLTPETIAALCLDKYQKLPKTGKPTDTQWTVLAGIVSYDSLKKCGKVVSLGLGTKCIGASKLCPRGLIINDAHAEVLARRGFLRYLYHQMVDMPDSILNWNEQRHHYELKPQYTFHFFSTKSPCGDASIVDESMDVPPPTKRLKVSSELMDDNGNVGQLLSSNVLYTGAKLFGKEMESTTDAMLQRLGALRIKPGKGDRTLSMSCSDKLSKWCLLGVQGALLDALLGQPIFFASLNFVHGCDLDALRRATFERWRSKLKNFNFSKYQWLEPSLRITSSASMVFECAPTDKRQQPSPNGLVWCDIPEELKPCEILVNGHRQGCTKKVLGTPQAASNVSKYRLLENFLAVLSRNDELLKKFNLDKCDLDTIQYASAKQLATRYHEAWSFVKAEVFGEWTTKPKCLRDFSLKNVE